MSVRLRPASPEDAGPAGAICYEAFKTIAEQHRFPPDLPPQMLPTISSHICCHGPTSMA